MNNIELSDLHSSQIEPQELSNLNLSVQTKIQGGISWDEYFPTKPSPTFPTKPSPTFPTKPSSTFEPNDFSGFPLGSFWL